MATVKTSHWIDASPEEVFDYTYDVNNCPDWMQGLVHIEIEGGGPFEEGAVFHETRRMFGREASETMRVTRFDRPSRCDVHCNSSCGNTTYDFSATYTPENGGTRLDMVGEIQAGSFFGKVMSGLCKGMMRKALSKDSAALKAAIEAKAGPDPHKGSALLGATPG